jgi:type I restriction-modification system DNA methylase subunit/restriction endonuclease S subunit
MTTTKQIENEVVWKLEQNAETNEAYKSIKSNLQNLIKQAHDLLYSNGSVVGVKAQNDIMRILCLVILRPYFYDEESEIWKRYILLKEQLSAPEKYIGYCKDLTTLAKQANVLNQWANLVKRFLVPMFPSIYYEDDAKFNCSDENTIIELIRRLTILEVNNDFIDAFATSCGDIHESFRAYGGGKGAKELGQYFTPRHLIHLIFHGLGLQDIVQEMQDVSIYDPCMGTGGFLTRMYALTNVKSENVYGCETEQDTIKFGNMSMVLTTKKTNANIEKCDSLCQNPFIFTKKMEAIVTNPPFGTKMKYKDLQKKFNDYKAKEFPESTLKFKDVYPIEVNNGACLFIQHCVFMLDIGGVCAIVLPDGELFEGNGKWQTSFREWWCKTVDISNIVKVPSGTFQHAGVKTNVVIFRKLGLTTNITCLETIKQCDAIWINGYLDVQTLNKNGYMLSFKNNPDNVQYSCPKVRLGDIFDITTGTLQSTKNIDGKYPFITAADEDKTHIDYTHENECLLYVNGSSGSLGKVKHWKGGKFIASSLLLIMTKKECANLLYGYVYQYLHFYKASIINPDNNYVSGSSKLVINLERFSKIEIPLPPPETQQKIIEELSALEQSINTIKTRIEQLKRERDLYMKHGRTAEIREYLNDSELMTLGDVCKVVQGTYITKEMKMNGEFPVYGGGNVSSYINQFNRENEIIVAKDGISNDCVRYEKGKFFLNHHGWSVDCYELIQKTYMYYWLYFNQFKLFKIAKGVAQLGINKENFYKLKIQVPSFEIQQQCIEIFKEKEEYLSNVQLKIDKEKQYIEELKKLGKDIIASYCA